MSQVKDCDYYDDHDSEGQPCGNRCGKPATKSIRWINGSYSLGCNKHIAEIRRNVPKLIRYIRSLKSEVAK